MDKKNGRNAETMLREWRVKILNGFLIVVAVASAAGTVVSIMDAVSRPGQWPAAILFASLEFILIVLAIFRRINYNVRAWGVLLVPYIVGVTNLASFGLGSSGRLFLLAVPIGGLILIGVPSGIIMSGLVALTMAAFTILSKLNLIQQWLITDRNSLFPGDWFAESTDTWILVLAIMALLIMFYRFQESLLRKIRRGQAEVLEAHGLLEEHNVTLEQKVQERTSELLQRNSELATLNSISVSMSQTLDVKALTRIIGDKLLEIFDSDSAMIMLLDRQTNLIHVPYEFDKNEGGYIDYVEPFPLGTGLSSKVITTGQPLMLGTVEEEVANGAYFPPEIIEKGEGKLSQSWLGVPIVANEQVLGLIALANADAHAFKENHMRLMQTLSANVGVALENARLFEAEQQRAAELSIINSVQEGLASRLDMQGIYDLVGEKIREVFDAQVVSLTTYDGTTDMLQAVYLVEKAERIDVSNRSIAAYGFRKHVIQTRRSLVINKDMDRLSEEYGNPVYIGGDVKSAIFVPMIAGQQVIGVISLQNLDRENVFTESDVRLLETLANAMSVALENARLFDETQRLLKAEQRSREQAEILRSVAQALNRSLSLTDVFNLVLIEIQKVIPYDSAGIYQVRGNRREFVTGHGFTNLDDLIGVSFEFNQREDEIGYLISQSLQPLILGDASEKYPQYFTTGAHAAANIRSFMAIPILLNQKLIGMITLDKQEPDFYTEQHAALAMTLAAQSATAINNARLFDETQRLLKETEQRNRELAIINETQQALASKLDLQAMIDLFGDKIMHIFPPQKGKEHNYSVFIALYDHQTDLIQFPYLIDGQGNRFSEIPTALGPGLTSQVIRSGQALVLKNLEEQTALGAEAFTDQRVDMGSQSWLGVPIRSEDRVIGVFSVQDQRPNLFTESDVRLLSTLAASLGVALENARLFTETQRLLKETEQRNLELAILNRISDAMSKTLDVKTLIRTVGERLIDIFAADSVSVTLLDRSTNMLQRMYEFDKGEGGYVDVDYIKPYPLGKGMTSRVILSRQPLLAGTYEEQIANGAYIPQSALDQTSGKLTQSWLGVPIIINDQAVGVIHLGDYEKYAFGENQMRLLQTLCANMGVTLENARLFNETQRLLKETEQRATELAAVNTVSAALASELDVRALIHLVGEQTRTILKADIAYVALLDESSNTINFPYTYGEEIHPMNYGQGLTSKIIQTNQPLLINQETDRRALDVGPTVVGQKSLSYLGVPIAVSGKAVGVLSVQSTSREGMFSEKDVRLLSTIASSVSTALHNARLFAEIQKRRKEAETLRQAAAVVSSSLELRQVLDSILISLKPVVPYDSSSIMLLDGEHVRLAAVQGFENPELVINSIFPANNQLLQEINRIWKPIILPDAWEDPRFTKWVDMKAVHGWMGVPLITRDKIIGYITLDNNQPATYNEDQAALVQAFAHQAATAINNARLFDEVSEAAEKLRLIFANAFDGIDIYEEYPDEKKRVLVDCNERYCELAGRSKEELISVENTGIFQRSITNPWDDYGKTILDEKAFSGVFSWIRPDGKENIIEYHAAPTRVGDRYFTIGIDRDITERMHAEEELKKARINADQANAAKSAFLANMSHELRTPLNAIIGFTRIVRRKAEGVLPEKQTDNLDKVLVSADHLLNLINTVLDIAKIEAGRMDVLAANFRVAALVDLCANTAQPLLRPNVILEKQVDESLTTIFSDQDKIRQIILNLLSNAAKFTHKGRITLTAKPDGDYLRISVADTGIGISEESLPRIFKEFQQADNSTTRQYGGTGLGLSISRNLARLLGGDITVESKLGKGSTFTLVTPMQYRNRSLASVDSALDQKTVSTQKADQHQTPSSTKKRILVIDDDPDAVYLLQENLNQQEFEISGARNGHDGIRLAREQKPQAILLDILMPETDGWQVLHDLKEDPETANIPVILLTIVDKKALGFRLGAAAYLLKPLDPVAVRDALNRVIGETADRQKHVLVVDDDPNIADMLRQFLPESEFRLEAALDGMAGLEAVTAKRPDIILLDIVMPRLDGFGVIERLRADPKTCDLPIIVISAKELTVTESDRLKETVALVMKKQGFQGEKLVDEIKNVLR